MVGDNKTMLCNFGLSALFTSIINNISVAAGCSLQLVRPNPGGGGTWVFFGWVCAARASKLAPRSKENFSQKLILRSRIRPKTDTPF